MRLPIRHFLLLCAFSLASLSVPIAAAAVDDDDIGWDEDDGEADDEDFAEVLSFTRRAFEMAVGFRGAAGNRRPR